MKDKHIAEFTLGALLLGILLSLLMCAANIYVGLFAGMTVSASIPAAVISMGILRGLLRRGTILENNIVQTIASAGESLAAGIVFTIPALVIAGAWTHFNFWVTSLVALLGGLLGILFMIPLRRALVVEQKDLIYPEGVACSEVLKAGETGGAGMMCVFIGVIVGVVFKFLVKGVAFIKETVEGGFRIGTTALYGGIDMSVALIGVGYIIGFNISILVCIGGIISWVIGIPLYGIFNGIPEGAVTDLFWSLWSTQIRYMGIGAMIVGGIWSIIQVRTCLVTGVREAIAGYRKGSRVDIENTSRDLPSNHILIGLAVIAVFIFILYSNITRSMCTACVASGAMLVASFFFVAVASYVSGLVGSSNNPVSGMVIVTVIFASVLLLLFQMTGMQGLVAALLVAGVVCCATCSAADISQDLKTGYIVGATPQRQQIAQMVGVGVAAFLIAPVLTLLHKAYGIGTGEPGALSAPQASLFASLVQSLFSGGALPWTFVLIGAGIGIMLITGDAMLKKRKAVFRLHVMPIAVGIYLPLSLSIPIALGGIMRLVVKHMVDQRDRAEHAVQRGILFSSGLIAGEAITGIILALVIVSGVSIPIIVVQHDVLSLVLFAGVGAVLVYIATKCTGQNSASQQ
jgi:putative OPT family oligopeptide transporter